MPFRSLRYLALIVGLGTMMAACSSAPSMRRLPDMSFRNLPPVQLDIGRIEVVSQFQPPAQAPHIEFDMPVSPENAVKRWVQDHLQPIGRTGTLRVVIRDASATETPLKTDQGFTGMFKKEQAARVDMSVDIALQMLDDRQFVTAEVSGKQQRSRTEQEGQKLNDRDKLLYDMVDDLIIGLNGDVDGNIRSTFGPWMGMK
ncbi:hypothetical protein [Telmatospirillum sp.]|uniref:hypothetical protein n=1 Tax=Telmatospirillum sp. TaxID=2079197 RepID=UPI00284BCB4E|nr:hypothetical protein [Telmatospirillum sp.]MDR3441261.1 hypothetical protein [Telmatospirillum sp.]